MDSNGSTETLSWSWPSLIPSPPPPVYQTSPRGGEGPGDEARSWPWLSIVSLEPGLIAAPNLWHSFGVTRQKSGMVNPGLRLNKMVGHLHTCTHTRPTSLVHVLVKYSDFFFVTCFLEHSDLCESGWSWALVWEDYVFPGQNTNSLQVYTTCAVQLDSDSLVGRVKLLQWKG